MNYEITPEVLEIVNNRKVSYSSLKEFAKSPQHFVGYCIGEKKVTDAMNLGTLVDAMVFYDEDYFQNHFLVMPKVDRRTKDGKETFEKYMAIIEANRKEGKKMTLVDVADYELAKRLKENLFKNEQSSVLLNEMTISQKYLEWTDKESGIVCCGLFDAASSETKKMLDLKVPGSINIENPVRHYLDMKYHIQAPMYIDGYVRNSGVFISEFYQVQVESSIPNGVAVFRIADELIEYGRNEYKFLLMKMKHCRENNLWHQSYDFHSMFGPHNIELPAYLRNKFE